MLALLVQLRLAILHTTRLLSLIKRRSHAGFCADDLFMNGSNRTHRVWGIRALCSGRLAVLLVSALGLGAGALLVPKESIAQLALIAGVRLQNGTPGAADAGHANITGRLLVGDRVGIGTTSPMSPLHVNGTAQINGLLMPSGAAAGRVLTSDAIGNATWQSPSGGGLSLPFTGSSSQPGSGVFEVTNSANGSGWGVRGHSASTTSGQGAGVYGTAVSGFGVYGLTTDASASTSGVWGQSASTNGRGVVGYSSALSGNNSFGVVGQSDSTGGSGVFGYVPFGTGSSGVLGKSDGGNGVGVRGIANSGGFASGVWGESSSGYGVFGTSSADRGVGVVGQANVNLGYGVWGTSSSSNGIGVVGEGQAYGVAGDAFASTGVGVLGRSVGTFGRGVTGISFGGTTSSGVYGESANGSGVRGYSPAATGDGVYGEAPRNGVHGFGIGTSASGVRGAVSSGTGNAGVFGVSTAANGNGVIGEALSGTSAYGVWARAAQGTGVYCQGALTVTGAKAFRIDHPFDPENRYLYHYCSEGPEPLNVYRGNVVTDARGYATVSLPDYVEEINRDFTYQLTVVDGSDDFVFAKVVRGVSGNAFVIRTSKPGVHVCWEVKGARNDLYTRKYGAPVEVEKTEKDRGTYQHPELYGQPMERMFGYMAVRDRNGRKQK